MYAPSAAPPAALAEGTVPRHQTLADLRSVAVLDVLADPGRSVARLRPRATSGTHGPTPSEGYVHLR
jgi:hypothetical protein